MKIFIHLRHGFKSNKWKQMYEEKLLPDLSPYGYHHAEKFGCQIEFSTDYKETKILNILRRGLGKILGFDLIHAKRNLKLMKDSDVIWTHTEYEFLAVLFWLRKIKRKKNPKIISQIIWLADNWNKFSFIKKFIYKSLLKEADILTFHSPENLEFMEKIIPNIKKELVPFGISLDSFPLRPIKNKNIKKPIKVLSVGNDIHRDWGTFLNALGNKEDIEVRILNKNLSKKLENKFSNLTIIKPKNLIEIKKNYEWADIVVVPLKNNLHASGITVILESITFGKPVICSDTGGLRAYFSENEVCYISVNDSKAIYNAILRLANDKEYRYNLIKNAQKILVEKELTSEGFAKRHCKVSKRLLENE